MQTFVSYTIHNYKMCTMHFVSMLWFKSYNQRQHYNVPCIFIFSLPVYSDSSFPIQPIFIYEMLGCTQTPSTHSHLFQNFFYGFFFTLFQIGFHRISVWTYLTVIVPYLSAVWHYYYYYFFNKKGYRKKGTNVLYVSLIYSEMSWK